MGQTTLEEDFRHLADSYRWLASAECAMRDLRDGFTDSERSEVERLLPNLSVALVASALTYARSIIEFFVGTANDTKNDIRATGFEVDLRPEIVEQLRHQKKAIDKHLMHLTTNRENYEREGVDRVEWFQLRDGSPGQVHELVDLLVGLLRSFGQASTDLEAGFEELRRLVGSRRIDRSTRWEPRTWSVDAKP